MSEISAVVSAHLRDVPDFPSPGILFKDIGPLIGDAQAFAAVTEHWRLRHQHRVDAVVGIDARGFIFGGALALALGVGFVPVRKAGKLPGPTVEKSYDLEYGSATLAVQRGALEPGQRVVVIDDVLATGGTARAACELIEEVGGEVTAFEVVLELAALDGRAKLSRWPVEALATG
ncbi:MAG: adenine phosphoribosyltransferase [Tetrasphaera sp.]|nr:adenine phosphoribosyltransferase [Tetrasphaera sp.]